MQIEFFFLLETKTYGDSTIDLKDDIVNEMSIYKNKWTPNSPHQNIFKALKNHCMLTKLRSPIIKEGLEIPLLIGNDPLVDEIPI